MAPITLCEWGHIVQLFNPDDHTTAASSEVFSMADYAHATIIVQKGPGSASTIVLEECDDFVPTAAASLAFRYAVEATAAGDTLTALALAGTAGIAISPNTGTLLVIELDADELSAGYECVRIKHSAAGASIWSAIAVLSSPRYAASITKTAIV